MRQVGVYSACRQVSWATQTATSFLALWCLFFGSAVAVVVAAPIQERLENLLIFGLAPALVFYVIGQILRGILGVGCKLCERLAASLLGIFAAFAISFANWLSAAMSEVLHRCMKITARCRITARAWTHRLSLVSNIAYCSVSRQCRHLHELILGLSCLLIRTTAQSLLKLQCLVARRRVLSPATRSNVGSVTDRFGFEPGNPLIGGSDRA
jgi:hypothetical protein